MDHANSKEVELDNPYYISDQPELTQISGWLHAWQPGVPSHVAVPRTTTEVAHCVRFCVEHGIRIIVKSTGHDYLGRSSCSTLGTSNGDQSMRETEDDCNQSQETLLIWVLHLDSVDYIEQFHLERTDSNTGNRCATRNAPPMSEMSTPAHASEGIDGPISHVAVIGPGARWGKIYDRILTRHGRYIQGGGCLSVGVSGFVLGGGLGAYSKRYGTGAGSLVQATVVTADGSIITCNQFEHPDLFWALRGGGGSTFGIVTSFVMRTFEPPVTMGQITGRVECRSCRAQDNDDASDALDPNMTALVERFLTFVYDNLNNANWGERVDIRDGCIILDMVYTDLDQDVAEGYWTPFMAWLQDHSSQYEASISFSHIPFRQWDYEWVLQHYPEAMGIDTREQKGTTSPPDWWWKANQSSVGEYIYNYASRWIPRRVFQECPAQLALVLCSAARNTRVSLYWNKGLDGVSPDVITREKETSFNPVLLESPVWALVRASTNGVVPSLTSQLPSAIVSEIAEQASRHVASAITSIRELTPDSGTYSNEADYHEPNWKSSLYGVHYDRLLQVKQRYDPDDVFCTHHSIGSDDHA